MIVDYLVHAAGASVLYPGTCTSDHRTPLKRRKIWPLSRPYSTACDRSIIVLHTSLNGQVAFASVVVHSYTNK